MTTSILNRTTIQLNLKDSQKPFINILCSTRKISQEEALRDLFRIGIDLFDKESKTVSPNLLFGLYDYFNKLYFGFRSEDVVLEINRNLMLKIRLRAAENEIEVGQFIDQILSNALVDLMYREI